MYIVTCNKGFRSTAMDWVKANLFAFDLIMLGNVEVEVLEVTG